MEVTWEDGVYSLRIHRIRKDTYTLILDGLLSDSNDFVHNASNTMHLSSFVCIVVVVVVMLIIYC